MAIIKKLLNKELFEQLIAGEKVMLVPAINGKRIKIIEINSFEIVYEYIDGEKNE